MAEAIKIHEVNERILNEINRRVKDPNKKRFLLEILSFELEHFDEGGGFKYKDYYKKLLEKYYQEND